MTLDYDSELLSIIDIDQEHDLEVMYHEVSPGQVLISAFGDTDIDHEGALLTVKMQAKSNGQLSQTMAINHEPLAGELYTAALSTQKINMQFVEEEASEEMWTLTSVAPNPLLDFALFKVEATERTTFTLEIFDITGRIVYITEDVVERGPHAIRVTSDDLGEVGTYGYRLSSAKGHSSGKLIYTN